MVFRNLNVTAKSALYALVLTSAFSCIHSKAPFNSEAGANLGFEFAENDIPVNWIYYTPPGAEQKISVDTNGPKEGRQSLRIEVAKADNSQGKYPGITKEFPQETKGGGKYRISFWVKSKNQTFRMQAGGVNAKESSSAQIIREDSGIFSEWKKIFLETDIPADMWLRFEVQLTGTGSFWMDGVSVEKVK